jgi:hypothetical protein
MPTEQTGPQHRLTAQDQRVTEQARKIIRQSTDVLRQNPSPDTFLGHKTQEPFPQEQDGTDLT